MRIYLDTNVFACLFDDRSHPTVEIEAQAALILFTLIESKKLTCLSSDILKLEIEHCSLTKRIRLQSLICLCSQHVSENESIKFLAEEIYEKCGVAPRDALHIASACVGKSDFFVTCDYEISKKAKKIEKVLKDKGYNTHIRSILDFMKEVEE